MPTNRHPLHADLAGIVGAKYVADDEYTMHAYSHDSSASPPGAMLGVAVRPGTTEEVVEIVNLANRTKTSIVPRGGGASIKGYVAGEKGRSILLDATRLDRIVNIDTETRVVTAEGGIILGRLANRLAEKGHFIHTVTVPQYMDTLGGLMSGQQGGGQGHDNVPNWRFVLGFKVVLPDGSVIDTGAGPGRNVNRAFTYDRCLGGPDLTGLFIGDCGTFGIKTEVTLQIFPPRPFHRTGSFAFADFDAMWRAISALMQFEPYGENLYTRMYAVDPEGAALFSEGKESAWTIFYGVDGTDEPDVARRAEIIRRIGREAGGRAGSDALDAIAHALYVENAYYDTGGLVTLGMWSWNESYSPKQEAAKHFLDWRAEVHAQMKRRDMFGYAKVFSHILPSDGGRMAFQGTHLIFDDSVPGARQAAFEIEERYRHWVAERGLFTENTQGRDANVAARHWSPQFRAFMKSMKRTLDPNNIMNPGVWDNL